MKNYTLFIFILLSSFSYSQVPQEMNYQASIIGMNNVPLANKNISLLISILDSSVANPIIYQETFSVLTDSFGLFDVQIGNGSVISGSFNTIDWGNNSKWQMTEVDTTGGSGFHLMGISKFVSVPYALYADKAKNNFSHFGEYLKTFYINSVYHAASDGFLIINAQSLGSGCLGIPAGFVTYDSIANPSAYVEAFGNDATTTIPIKKNYYWKYSNSTCPAHSFKIKWLPLE